MEFLTLEVVLLLFGAVVLCIALFGRVETQWFKLGSDSSVMRASSFLIGTLLIGAALLTAGVFPFYSSKSMRALERENLALQTQLDTISSHLSQIQKQLLATTAQLPDGGPGGLQLPTNEEQAAKMLGPMREYTESVAERWKRLGEIVSAMGDPEAMRDLDPVGAAESDDGDDAITDAKTIALGETYEAEIRPYTDVDFYKVPAAPNAPRALRAIVRKPDVQGLVTRVVILDQNENVVEKQLDMTNPTLSFPFQRPPGDHFYLSVASQGLPSALSVAPQQGPYELVVRAE